MGYWDIMMKETFYLEDLAGRDNSGDPSFSNKRSAKCRPELNVWNKTFFQGRERERFDKLATNEELAADWEGRVWFPADDETDDTKARQPYIIKPVYDEQGVFSHTVLEF